MKQFGLFAVSAILATAIHGLFVPRQDDPNLSDFYGTWYTVGMTSDVYSMLQEAKKEHGITCACPRAKLEEHKSHSERIDVTSTFDLKQGDAPFGVVTTTSSLEYEEMHGDMYTFEYHFGELRFESAEHHMDGGMKLPKAMFEEEDMDLQSQFLSDKGDDHDAVLFYCEHNGITVGTLYYSAPSIDEDAFDKLVDKIKDSKTKDSMVRFEEGCD